MIIGNAMNSAALALDRFYGELKTRKAEIETLLVLGAPVQVAVKDVKQSAIIAAMLPQINIMMIVGLVSLPGMMTGQILAGQSPLTAVTYQIMVMFMLPFASLITIILLLRLIMPTIFNKAEQLTEH